MFRLEEEGNSVCTCQLSGRYVLACYAHSVMEQLPLSNWVLCDASTTLIHIRTCHTYVRVHMCIYNIMCVASLLMFWF